jgi:hypothetical protein
VLLTIQQAYELLARHGVYAREICDKCGVVLGAVRFTRKDDSGVWCSRECRGGADARQPGTCKTCKAKLPADRRRDALYCDDACKQNGHRGKTDTQTSRPAKLSVTKPSINAGFSSGKQAAGISGHPEVIGGPRA